MKEFDWGFLGLKRFLNKKRELFFFDILEPKTWASVQFHLIKLHKMINLFGNTLRIEKIGWLSGLGAGG